MKTLNDHPWILDLLAILFPIVAIGFVLLAIYVIHNYRELKNRPRMDHRVLHFKRPSDHGHACTEFLRAIAEACTIFLLLASVLGYWFYNGH